MEQSKVEEAPESLTLRDLATRALRAGMQVTHVWNNAFAVVILTRPGKITLESAEVELAMVTVGQAVGMEPMQVDMDASLTTLDHGAAWFSLRAVVEGGPLDGMEVEQLGFFFPCGPAIPLVGLALKALGCPNPAFAAMWQRVVAYGIAHKEEGG